MAFRATRLANYIRTNSVVIEEKDVKLLLKNIDYKKKNMISVRFESSHSANFKYQPIF